MSKGVIFAKFQMAQLLMRDFICLCLFLYSLRLTLAWISYWGYPVRKGVFESFLRSLWKMVNTQLNFSSAYHPKIDGKTKVVNRSIGNLLRCLVGDHVKAWDQKLCQAELAHNHVVNRNTRFSPFQVVYSAQPRGHLGLMTRQVSSSIPKKVEDFVAGLHDVHKVVRDNLIGPLEIVEKLNSNAYRLKLPSHIRCSDVFNVKHLLPYHGNSSDEDSVGNSRTNFVYLGGNDVNPSIEERADLHVTDQKRRHVDFEVGDFVWAVLTKDHFPIDVFNVKHLLPYHGNSFDEDSVGNSRTNFVYLGGNDVNPSIEERDDLFLEARDRVNKGVY
nr:putative reverse transcriptase domain-containing protein [Tanacetum cinerariifolium]